MCFNVLGRHIISPHPAIPMPRALGRPLPQGRGRGLYRLPLEGGAGQSRDSGSGLRGWLRANDRLEFAAARGVTPSDRCAATSPLKGEGESGYVFRRRIKLNFSLGRSPHAVRHCGMRGIGLYFRISVKHIFPLTRLFQCPWHWADLSHKGEVMLDETTTTTPYPPKTASSLPPDGPYRGPYYRWQPRLIYRRSGTRYRHSG